MARRRIITSTTGYDSAFAFVGSSPIAGDQGGLGLLLPPDPTVFPRWRYLCRLCALEIPFRTCAILRGVRQYLTIGQVVETEESPDYVVERQVVTPHWHFNDGNVSWHVLSRAISKDTRVIPAPGAPRPPNWSPDDRGLGPAILYRTLPASLGGGDVYRPLYGGSPPGKPVSGLGMIHDMRYPWDTPFDSDELGAPIVAGPGRLELWASVRQTDTEERFLPELPTTDGLPPEETFLQNYRNARYWRIAGQLTVDMRSTRERCI